MVEVPSTLPTGVPHETSIPPAAVNKAHNPNQLAFTAAAAVAVASH